MRSIGTELCCQFIITQDDAADTHSSSWHSQDAGHLAWLAARHLDLAADLALVLLLLLLAEHIDPAFLAVPVGECRGGARQRLDPLCCVLHRHLFLLPVGLRVPECDVQRALGGHPPGLLVVVANGECHERVLQELRRGPSIRRVSGEAAGQEVLALLGHPGGHLRHGVRVSDPVERGEDVAAVHVAPRRAPRGHLDDRAPERPDVGGRALLLPARHLGRHERRRASDRSPRGADCPPRAAEVGELGAAVGADHDVPGLDVAVHDGGRPVEVGEAAEDVRRVGPDGALAEGAAIPGDLVGEGPAGGVLEEEVVRAVRGLGAAGAAHDVGRGQRRQEPLLPSQRRRRGR
ncbi:hypothetical protein HU200_047081 [Digitaria exilis]|uniref:Uncharacterized protein n=1 Tax=Digitaria exilis TaxID=1010633 RepID=A0A835AZW8_9POAL|nr:hypothetical protein HU200_047081 [Digitaria exilis]